MGEEGGGGGLQGGGGTVRGRKVSIPHTLLTPPAPMLMPDIRKYGADLSSVHTTGSPRRRKIPPVSCIP